MKVEILNLVKEKYTKEDFKYHIIPVVKNAMSLAKRLSADKDVVIIWPLI